MAKRIFSYVFLAVLSLSCLSVSFEPKGSRGIACVDPLAEANVLPIYGSLFGEIQDEALRKTTLDYYLFLSKVEMQALAGRQSIWSAYGISDGSHSAIMPTVNNFDLGGNTFASGHLWGQVSTNQPSLTVGKSLPQLITRPQSMSFTAGAVKSPMSGIAFPAVNSTGHKVGM